MTEDETKKGLSEKQKITISGMSGYATHYKVPFGDWQANRLMVKQKENKTKPVFIDYKK